jgi:hypothetical protein
MRHDINSCDQDDEDRDDAWLDGPIMKVKGKSRLRSEGPVQSGAQVLGFRTDASGHSRDQRVRSDTQKCSAWRKANRTCGTSDHTRSDVSGR